MIVLARIKICVCQTRISVTVRAGNEADGSTLGCSSGSGKGERLIRKSLTAVALNHAFLEKVAALQFAPYKGDRNAVQVVSTITMPFKTMRPAESK